MIDLTTTYLGMKLNSPVVCSSSPLCESLDALGEMEACGAGAVVLTSLFEEQIQIESHDLDFYLEHGAESYSEAVSYFPDMADYNLGSAGYLNHLRKAKANLKIPVIASLNGYSPGGWIDFAGKMEDAGADALELNLYHLPTRPSESSHQVELGYLELVREIRRSIRIPLAIKLGPFFTAPIEFSRRLSDAGADALVLFNRFYQPDFNLETLEVESTLSLSTPQELLMRLHWVALLYDHVKADLAVTGGVHSGLDVLKVMMAGGRVAMMTSALLKHGIPWLRKVLDEVVAWMTERDYASIGQMQGSMSFRRVANPSAFERSNYMKVLKEYPAPRKA